LLIGKVEAGKLEFQPIPIELIKFCRNLIKEIQFNTNSHIITFCTQEQFISADLDEKLLRQIFSNLLSNAIKYSPQGGNIQFDLIYEPEKVVFRVQDKGIGIPVGEQTKLFDSFYRASNVGNISGTGLGLAIVKKSVDLHNGSIAVESEVGLGTIFVVTLPLNN